MGFWWKTNLLRRKNTCKPLLTFGNFTTSARRAYASCQCRERDGAKFSRAIEVQRGKLDRWRFPLTDERSKVADKHSKIARLTGSQAWK